MGVGRESRVTLLLVNLAGIMERADESLLPAVYAEIGASLHASPTALGSLTLFRSIVQSACYPLATYLSARHNRASVIALGAFLWAAATILVGLSSTYLQAAVSRALNGIGLALVGPAMQSLVADCTDDENRGTAFGWLHLTGMIGAVLGGVFSLVLAPTSFMGIEGWRLAFHLVAMLSIIVGIIVYLFAVDPRYTDNGVRNTEQDQIKSVLDEVKELYKEAKTVIKIPTFQIIVIQGVTGAFPWSSIVFAPMWMELIGFSHGQTGLLMSPFLVAVAVGGLFGGRMGDFLAKHFPNSGRIVLSQLSSGSAVPLAAILLLVLPYDPSSGFEHGLALFFMGLSMSWFAPATNNPIFAEIVPEKSRTNVYALAGALASVLSSFAPPTVGFLAEHVYGYKPVPREPGQEINIKPDRGNAASLAKALFVCIAVPMSLSSLIYSFLYCTYPRDRERARMDALMDSEMQQLYLKKSRLGLYGDEEEFYIDDEDASMLIPNEVGLSKAPVNSDPQTDLDF